MTTPLYPLSQQSGQSSRQRLGGYLFGQYGPALPTGAPGLPGGVSPEMMAGLNTLDQQYARYSNYQQAVTVERNQLMAGPASAAVYTLHPEQIAAASNELDRREIMAQMQADQYDEQQFASLVDLARKYPRIDAGILHGMAMGGITDGSPEGQHILELAHQKTFNDDQAAQMGSEITPEKVMSSLGPDEKEYNTNPLIRALRASVRTTLGVVEGAGQALGSGLQAAWLEAQGQGDAGERLERLGDEGGGGSLAEILRGAVHDDEDVQLGPGWLPQQGGLVRANEFGEIQTDGTGAQIAAGEAVHRRIMQFEGRFLTVGRLIPESLNATTRDWFGWNAIEPGGKAYNVTSWASDVAYQLAGGNPSNLAADAPAAVLKARRAFAGNRLSALTEGLADVSGVTAARRAKTKFDETASLRDLLLDDIGAIRGTRKTVDSDRAVEWLGTADGSKFVDYVAGEKSLTKLMSIKGIGLREAELLRGADSSVAVKDILKPLMGQHITSAPMTNTALGAGAAWRGAGGTVDKLFNTSTLAMKRLTPHFGGGSSGGMILNPGDLDGVFYQMQDWMKNSRFTPDEIESFNRALARLPDDGNPIHVERLMREKFDKIAARHVAEYTGDERLAHLATRRYRKQADKDRMFWVNAAGKPRRVTGSEMIGTIDGQPQYAPNPAVMAEYLQGGIPMPDPGEMRRMTAMRGVNKLVNMQGYKNADRILTKLTGNVWKPAVLLRPAYVLRVGLAEQARMAAAGFDSFLSHPASAMAYALGRRGDVDLADGGKLIRDSKQFRGAMNRLTTDTKTGRAGWMADSKFRAFSRLDDEDAYFTGWANEVQMVSEDPVAQHLLEFGRDDTIEWFWDGQGRAHREALMVNENKRAAFSRRGVDAEADDYIDSVDGYVDDLQEIINQITGGDTDLLAALRTGKLGDIPIPNARWSGKERRQLRQILAAKSDDGIGPSYVRGTQDAEGLASERAGFIDRIMDGVLTRPTNFLSRAPLFKQGYWDNMIRMAGDMDADTLAILRKRAVQADMDSQYLKQLDSIKPKAAGADSLLDDIDAADLLAKDQAAEFVKSMLYDPTIRGNFATMMRNIMPFAEAWKEELVVWSNLAREAPIKPAFRLGQGFEFLRTSNPFDLEEPNDGPGVFYTNQFGEEVFAVPVNFLVPGSPDSARAEMSIAGLSMMNFNTFLPGLGPVAQVPAKLIIDSIPDHHTWLRDTAMDIALPFGTLMMSETAGGELLDRQLPTWVRYAYQAFTADTDNPDRQRRFASMVSQTMQAKLISGDATTPQTPQEMEALIKQSAVDAKKLSILEALMKGVMPSTPNVEFDFMDDNKRLWNANVMSDYYYKLIDSFGEKGAVTQILKQFGSGGLSALLMSQTQQLNRNAMTESEFNWKRQHRDFYETHPEAAYHFTMADADSPFSFDAYNEAIADGTLLRLPVRQQALRMADRVGSLIYGQAKERALAIFGSDTSAEAREWLRGQNIEIKRSLFGYDTDAGFQRLNPEAELAMVAQALPDAPSSSVTQAIDELIQLHDEANQLAVASGVANYYESQAALPIRQGLQAGIDEIVSITPEAKSVGDLILALMRNADNTAPTAIGFNWGDGAFGASSPSTVPGPGGLPPL